MEQYPFGTGLWYFTIDIKEVRYGLDRYYPEEKDENVMELMKKPFGKLEK
jgi:hypothetical protein